MSTVRELLDDGIRRLRLRSIDQPGREAALLLRTVLGMSESALLAHDHDPVSADLAGRYCDWIERRAAGEPSAYIRGRREFWGRDFLVDDRVLVPRPETEHLVEIALEQPLPDGALVLEVGTGSGCVAVTVAAERPTWRVVATDYSFGAVVVARANAARHGVSSRVAFLACDLGAALDLARYDLILANLPYVDDRERGYLIGLDHEPDVAIFATRGGCALIEAFRDQAAAVAPGVRLACEIGPSLADALSASADPALWEPAELRRDLAGLDRNLIWTRRDNAAANGAR